MQVCGFTLLMLGIFAVFLGGISVRTGTPQIFRLRYYALQDGLEGGALSSSLGNFDWRKAFVWRASDTEYRQRQFSQFFEVLTPRLYSHLYYWFGPFMWLPLSLVCVFLIGLMIALVVRQWCGDWLPGLVAGSFWLLTTEVLVGHHAPIRYAKDFAALQILGIISFLLAMRGAGRGRRRFCLLAACFIWWLGLFTDEYLIFAFPALAVAFLTWPWLKPVRFRLLSVFSLLLAAGMLLFWFVLPDLITPDRKDPLARMAVRAMPSLVDKAVHNFGYLILNTRDIFTYTFGWPPPHSPLQTVLASLAGIVLILLVFLNRAWKGWGRMLFFWLIAAAVVGGVLLPEGTDILHQHTYYNRPLVALLLVILGLFTASIFRHGKTWCAPAWLVLLTAAGILNFATNATAIRHDPEEAYLTRPGLENILQLHDRLNAGELLAPVFVSYPQFRDVTRGVYDELEFAATFTLESGFPWSLYRSIMPRLYLRQFEEGELRADPRQFARWVSEDEHASRAAAESFYDMPAGTVWDLESIRKHELPGMPELEWRSDGRAPAPAEPRDDLLGKAPFARLGKGEWRTSLQLPSAGPRLAAIVAIRHDGPAGFRIEPSSCEQNTECDYGWSWRLFSVDLAPGADHVEVVVVAAGEVEAIGPVLVPVDAVAFIPVSCRERILPAGVPLLRLRGFLPSQSKLQQGK